ncbi:MAG: POTRA domain-containing protein, partial [Gemmatimonadales bacterium]
MGWRTAASRGKLVGVLYSVNSRVRANRRHVVRRCSPARGRGVGVLCLSLAATCAAPAPLTAQADQESRGLVVRQLSFGGNRAIDDNTLRLSIATSQSNFFARSRWFRWIGLGAKRYFNETEFRRDVLRILALYRQSGFSDASLDTLVRRTETDVFIEIRIHEGPPIRVASLEVRGIDSLLPERVWRRTLPLQPGDPFNRLLLQASADTIRTQLANRGHPFASVFRNFDVDREARRAEIWMDVDAGPHATVERVELAGAQRIDEGVIRRTLEVRPGEPFRQRDLYRSQLALYRMEAFNYVNVALADTAASADDSLVTVRVQVSEGPLQRIRVGGGYGTIDCFRTLGSWTVRNFLGGGRTLEVGAQLSQIGSGDPLAAGFETTVCPALADEDTSRLKLNYNVSATLREPFFFSRRTSAALT